jgi:hypothetical protein
MSPAITAIALLFFIAGWAVATGLFQIIGAIQLRKEVDNEWLLAINGLRSLLFGIGFPDAGSGSSRADLGHWSLRDNQRRSDDWVRFQGTKIRKPPNLVVFGLFGS